MGGCKGATIRDSDADGLTGGSDVDKGKRGADVVSCGSGVGY